MQLENFKHGLIYSVPAAKRKIDKKKKKKRPVDAEKSAQEILQ